MSQLSQGDDRVRAFRPSVDQDVQREVDEALGDLSIEELMDRELAPAGPGTDKDGQPAPTAPGVRRGRVVAVESRSVLVDLGGKSQGVIPLEQFDEHAPKVGDTVEGIFERYDPAEGLVHLSRRGAVAAAAWQTLEEGQIIEGRVTGVNKGGLELDVNGIRAFMPASQVDLYHVADISVYIGQRVRCQVTDLDRREKNLVVSRRALLELEQEQRREVLWAELEVGQVRQGVVRSIMPYGAFVDLGGVDGLVHISDLAWGRVEKAEDIVQAGQTVQVKVLKIDRDARKVSLGIKQLAADPWTTVADRVRQGVAVQGKVTRLAEFGAFVELEPGVEGLVPLSEMSWGRVKHAREVFRPGQEVQLMVLAVEPDRKRISLSLRQAQANPWVGAAGRYAVDSTVPGRVTRVVDFGAFVELEPGVEGLIHVSQLSDKRVRHPSDVVKEGQEVQARIISVNEQERKISLTLKTSASAAQPGLATSGGQVSQEVGAPSGPPPTPRKRARPLKGGIDRPDGSVGLGELRLPGT